ncbi:MAG: hypothetical protein V3T86_00095 [Planctomycetota bacterium]
MPSKLQNYRLWSQIACFAILLATTGCGPDGAFRSLFEDDDDGGGGGGGSFGPVEFQLPEDGSALDRVTTFTASGPGVARVVFLIEDQAVLDDTEAPFEYEFDPTGLAEQNATFGIKAYNGSQTESSSQSVDLRIRMFRPDLSEILDAVDNLEAGHWYTVPQTRIDDAFTPDAPGEFRGSISNIVEGASGGAFDTKRNRLIVWGGGGGSWRNEIWGFDLATMEWSRITAPSDWEVGCEGGNPCNRVAFPDGAPFSRHSYDFIEYVPEPVDRLYLGGGVLHGSNGAANLITDQTAYLFDFDAGTWSTNPASVTEASLGAIAAIGEDGKVWQHGGGQGSGLLVVDLVAETTTEHVDFGPSLSLSYTADIDPTRNLFIAVGGGPTRIWDLDNPDDASTAPATTGATEIESNSNPGVQYDPDHDCLVAWDGGGDIFTLDLDTWVWTRISPSGGTSPGAAVKRGTFGRFRYVPSKGIYIVYNQVNTNIYFYRLPTP